MSNILRAKPRLTTYVPKHPLLALLMAGLMLSFAASSVMARQSVTAPEGGDESSPPTIQDGQKFMQQQQFPEAAHIFEQVAKAQPANGQAWFFLGYCLHAQGKLDEALPAHLAAAELIPGQGRSTAMYNIACVYALKNNADKAFAWLDKAFENGFNNPDQLDQDTDMDNIREDERFAAYLNGDVASAPGTISGPTIITTRPAEDEGHEAYDDDGARNVDWASKPIRRRFDFWVGQWDAIGKNGKKVGTNVITRREKGNIIHESWTSADGSTGQSINYFDPSDKQWKQVWVSQGGGVVYYHGNFIDGAMRYEGDNIKPDGTKVHTECTLTPLEDGRIHHFIRHTADGGKTWTTYFDAHYVRQGSAD